MRAVSAKTVYPNTPETDCQRFVLHEVTLSDGSKRKIMAEDPIDAINKVNKELK